MMEKLVDIDIMVGVLKKHPLHRNQHAYQIGKEIALGTFSNIEGAPDRTLFGVITGC
jgi:hypothetical protein